MGGVSVLLPTRGRPAAMIASVRSLLEKADRLEDVEVLVAVDPDDPESARAGTRLAKMYGTARVSAWTAPERYGYRQLHRYVNFLASESTMDWLMVWNDDATMLTQGWDRQVRKQASNLYGRAEKVLWPECNHAQGGNLFPIWPSSWYHLLGHASLSPNVDVWISEIGRCLGIEQRIPVRIMHDRPDVTGADPDPTYLEGRKLMGQGNDPGYDSQVNRAARARAVRVLREIEHAKAG